MLPLGCQCTKSVPLPNRNELISNVDALDDDGYLRLSVNCVEDKIREVVSRSKAVVGNR